MKKVIALSNILGMIVQIYNDWIVRLQPTFADNSVLQETQEGKWGLKSVSSDFTIY